MAPPDVEAADRAAGTGQICLFDAGEARAGNGAALHLPHQAAAATAPEALCGAVRTPRLACTPASAALSSTSRVDAAASAPARSLESAVATTASSRGDRGVAVLEAATGSFTPSEGSASMSTARSAAVPAAAAEGPATSVHPAAQASESDAVEAAAVTPGRSSGASRTPATPEATGSSSDAAAASAAEVAEAAEATAGVEVSAAAADGTRACELEYVYVGQDCFFLELPDGTLTCVAGLENLPAASASAGDAEGTEAHAEGAGEEQIMLARLQCHNCLQLLEFDSRAYFVQCSSCLTLNAVPNQDNSLRGGRAMIVICGRCSTRNISCLGSVYVECWQCHTVCQVDYPTPAAAGLVNGQGSSAGASAAAAAAAAAAGDVITPAAQLDFSGRGGGAGLFGGSDSRRRLYRLQRRLHGGFWRSDDEESSVSAATRGDRGTRLSTAVELPPGLWSRGRGRSLLARHSFNPLPPRNLRVYVGGPPRGTTSSSSYREGMSSDAGTAAAQRSFPTTQLQRWRVQRQQHSQRLRWGARPVTAPAGVETVGGARSDIGANSRRLMSLLLRLPFHGKGSEAERRPSTAAALPGGSKNLRGRNRGFSSEEVEQATKTRRTRRPRRRAPAQVFSDRSVSDDSGRAESDGADERVPADRTGEDSGRAAEGPARRRGTRGMRLIEVTREVAESVGGCDATLPEGATHGSDREALSEAHDGRRVNRQMQRRPSFSENEDGEAGATQAGAPESFVPFDSNAITTRGREAAAGDVDGTPIDTQGTTRDTAYPLSPSVSLPPPTGHPGAFEESTSPAGSARAPQTQPSAGSARSVSETSRAAAPAPATVAAATRRNWMLSFPGSKAHARGVGQNDAAQTATAARASVAPQSNGELQTDTPLQVGAAPDGTDALRKSWRDAIRHWRPQERKETARARRVKYNIGRRGTGAVP